MEWVLTDFACTMNQHVSVGIHVAWPTSEVEYVIKNANISCVVCSEEMFPKFAELCKNCPSLKSIIVMDDTNSEM
jgi:long-subunit acyl-CoA synthetase (AMP-forming)